MPVLAEGKASPHEDILLNAITANDGAIRMGDWKLILNGDDRVTENVDLETGERKQDGKKSKKEKRTASKAELFNLRNDPSEIHDLAATQPEKVKELRRRYDAYVKGAVQPLQFQHR
jgi:arylsulfatase A-like enzyme